MAYINKDGRITIDEDVAMSDVRKAAEAERILRDAAVQLRNLISEAQEYQGETINAIIEKSNEMLKRTEKLISNLENTQQYTRNVVTRYQLLDQKCRAELEAAAKKL